MSGPLASFENSRMPVRKAIRRLRWFIASFHEHASGLTAETGQPFTVDDGKLTAAFMSWYRAFEAQKHKADADRRGYVTFAAGLMLRELLHFGPLTARRGGTAPDAPAPSGGGAPAAFWPEGHAYVTYCLAVRAAVLAQEFHTEPHEVPELSDLRTWWSFRENILEDPDLAISFLELFSGEQPHWTASAIFAPHADIPPLPRQQ